MGQDNGYEPSCASRCADGVIRGGLTGLAWGAFFYPSASDLASVLNATPASSAAQSGNNISTVSNSRNPNLLLQPPSPTRQKPETSVSVSRKPLSATSSMAAAQKPATVSISTVPQWTANRTVPEMIQAGKNALVPRLKCMGRSSWAFGGFCGVFSATVCVAERIRGKSHWGNEFVGGCVAGAFVVPRHSPQTMAIAAAAVGTLTAAGRFMKDD